MNSVLEVPVDQLRTDQVVVFDWYDGPRAGIIRFSTPSAEFQFGLLDERAQEDDVDDRLLWLKELPVGTVAEVIALLAPLVGTARLPVWVPRWPPGTEPELRVVEQKIDKLLASSQDTGIALRTSDLLKFRGIWSGLDFTQNEKWFDYLGI